LNPGDSAYINFNANTAPDGTYTVATVPDPIHFTITVATSVNQTQNGGTIYPLVPAPLIRSGDVTLQQGTWSIGSTDAALTQSPLNSPTVFNFFFPDYKFPGALAAAGITTPEFQLTSDTEVAVQMNFLEGGLLNNTANTNGLSSFVTGGGAIVLDLGPWMTPANTSNAGLPGLVDSLNNLLTGGMLSTSARNIIVNYAATQAYTTPTYTQMRDRVRAVVHLIVSSPDFTIQR
jgi:hypothetical protein